MALLYQPKEGSVLICDFRGYEVPEIIKIRPVIVIRKHRTNKLLVTVVPLSTINPAIKYTKSCCVGDTWMPEIRTDS
ncbi:type II toxin-antitoxin system PemK/MazF family toxin, partial [Pseudomonas lactis]|uniref:type II toxin-antitoxin system PemK/MazF family toxin n=1 Tax=Pseudomonas lactis TaxID=1615674 RepID=UPI003F8072B0